MMNWLNSAPHRQLENAAQQSIGRSKPGGVSCLE